MESKAGISKEIFVDKPPSSLICGVCKDVLNNPHQCNNGHCHCKTCAELAISSQQKCPKCLCDLDPTNLTCNLFVLDMINNLETKCSPDCSWIGPYSEREAHLNICENQLIPCENRGCAEKYSKQNQEKHQNECLKRLIRCAYCNKPMLFEFQDIHIAKCDMKLKFEALKLEESKKNAQRNGFIELFLFPNGNSYEGEWKDDLMHGKQCGCVDVLLFMF